MNDLATLCGTPRTITLDGLRVYLHPLTLSDFGDHQVWLDG